MKVMDEHSSEIEEPDDLVLHEAAGESPRSQPMLQKKLMAISTYFLLSTGSMICSAEQAEASILNVRLPHQSAASDQSDKSDREKEKERALSAIFIAALAALYFKMKIEQTSASK